MNCDVSDFLQPLGDHLGWRLSAYSDSSKVWVFALSPQCDASPKGDVDWEPVDPPPPPGSSKLCEFARYWQTDKARNAIAVELFGFVLLVDLIKKLGVPPAELIDDWHVQLLGNSDLQAANQASILVGKDAVLYHANSLFPSALLQAENWSPSQTTDSKSSPPPVDCSTLTQLSAADPKTFSALLASFADVGSGDFTNKSPSVKPPFSNSPDTAQLVNSELSAGSTRSVVAARTKGAKPSWLMTRRGQIIAASSLLGLFAVAAFLFLRPAGKQVAKAPADGQTKQSSKMESSPSNGETPESVEDLSAAQLDLSGIDVSPPPSSIPTPGSDALESMVQSLAQSGPPDAIESIKIDLETLLAGNDPNAIQQELQQKLEGTGLQSALNQPNIGTAPEASTGPLADQSNAAAGEIFPPESADDPNDDQPSPSDTDSVATLGEKGLPAERSYKTEVLLNKPLVQTKLRLPSDYQRKQVALRVEFVVPESLQMEPQDPIVIVGSATEKRTFFKEDEGSAIIVYVRSSPKGTWQVHLATRMKLTSDLTIVPDMQTLNSLYQYCLSQKAYWNNQQQILDRMRKLPRAIKKTFDLADDLIEAKMVELDESFKVLQDAQLLLQLFESSEQVALVVASSQGELPPVQNEAAVEDGK